MPTRLSLTLLACASALSLSACKNDQPAAPAAYDFASAPPAAVATAAPAAYEAYAPAERAHAFDRATYRAAPSYGFRYGREEPWAWRTADDYSMYAEPYDGGYRNYYYAPGADRPYFVRDDEYGYGYGPDGGLVAVYDARGALLPRDRLYAVAQLAGTYLVRASAVRRYALDDRYRVPVSDAYWADRAPRYERTREVWYAAPERQPAWRDWRASYAPQIAREVPRGEVRRWSRADDRAWQAYEQADRRAWKVEDQAWRKADRGEGRRVAVVAPPPAVDRPVHEDRRDRGHDSRPVQAPPQVAQAQPDQARAPRPTPDLGWKARRAEAARQVAQAQPEQPQAPRAARDHGQGDRHAQAPQRVAQAQPEHPQAPHPAREHGQGDRRAEAPKPVAQAAAARPDRRQGHGGRPDTASAHAADAAAQVKPARGGKGHGKAKEKDEIRP